MSTISGNNLPESQESNEEPHYPHDTHPGLVPGISVDDHRSINSGVHRVGHFQP